MQQPVRPPPGAVHGAPRDLLHFLQEANDRKAKEGVSHRVVTEDDVRKAAAQIKEKLVGKFGSLTKAFRAIDEDASGSISIEELNRYLHFLNLDALVERQDVLAALFSTIDVDSSGGFEFTEFARAISLGDSIKIMEQSLRAGAESPYRPRGPPSPETLGKELCDPGAAGLNSSMLLYEAHNVFTLADWDTSGGLDMKEVALIRQCVQTIPKEHLPYPLSPAIADKVVGQVLDTNGDGIISRTEWIEFILREVEENGEKAMLRLMQVLSKQLEAMPKI